jgi:hypothetical protein
MIEESFPAYRATSELGSVDCADAVAALSETNVSQTARRAPARGKGQAD